MKSGEQFSAKCDVDWRSVQLLERENPREVTGGEMRLEGCFLEKRCLLRMGWGRIVSKAKGSALLRKGTGDASAQGRWAHGAGMAKGDLFNTSRSFWAPQGA